MGKHKRNLVFTTTLLVTILVLLFFIGASITGYATSEPGADKEVNPGDQASLSEYPGPELESKLNFFSILLLLSLFVAITYFLNWEKK